MLCLLNMVTRTYDPHLYAQKNHIVHPTLLDNADGDGPGLPLVIPPYWTMLMVMVQASLLSSK